MDIYYDAIWATIDPKSVAFAREVFDAMPANCSDDEAFRSFLESNPMLAHLLKAWSNHSELVGFLMLRTKLMVVCLEETRDFFGAADGDIIPDAMRHFVANALKVLQLCREEVGAADALKSDKQPWISAWGRDDQRTNAARAGGRTQRRRGLEGCGDDLQDACDSALSAKDQS